MPDALDFVRVQFDLELTPEGHALWEEVAQYLDSKGIEYYAYTVDENGEET